DIIAQGLAARGHRVSYISPDQANDEAQTLNYSLYGVENSGSAIMQRIAALQPDIIYWRYNKHHFHQVAQGVRRLGIPFIFAVSHVNDVTAWSAKRGSPL